MCDAFPLDYEVSLDADADGLPDAWNAFCDAGCRESSSFSLDDDPTEHFDIDRDGFSNAEEIAEGTDPLDAGDFPATVGLNIVLIRAAIGLRK